MAASQINGDTVRHVLFVGVRINFRKHSAAKACGVQNIQRLGGDGQRSQRLICHQQGLFQASGPYMIAEFRNAAHAEFDGGGVVPVSVGDIMGHGVTLS